MNTTRIARKTVSFAWLLRGALLLNFSLGLSYIGLWAASAWQGLFWYSDFSAFYTGWAIVRDGQGARLYDLDLQARYQQQILAGHPLRDGLLPYVNPPYATIPFVPLSWLAHPSAYWLWTLGELALLIWLLRLLWQIARSWEPHERWLLLSAAIALPSLMIALVLGTFSLYMAVCFVQFYHALKRSCAARTGVWLALGTVKPQLTLAPGLILLGARRWRALGGALLIVGMLVILSGLALGWQSWLGFLQVLRAVNSFFGIYVYPDSMYNFRGTLTLLLGNDQGPLINQISTLALVIASVLIVQIWRGRWQPDHPSFELRIALTMLVGLLFTPHLYPHDGLVLIVPAALFYAYLRQRDRPRRAYAAFVLSCPLIFLVSEFTLKGSLGIQAPVVMMVALAIWMGKALVDERRAERSDPYSIPIRVEKGAVGEAPTEKPTHFPNDLGSL